MKNTYKKRNMISLWWIPDMTAIAIDQFNTKQTKKYLRYN